MEKSFYLPELDYKVITGKFAHQADGAVWLQQGSTVVLSTVVSSPPRDFPGFLPLSVDYRENFAAAGKIPGGYFKREGKSSDREVLTSRLIDRALRPLFPERYFDQVQVLSTVYSVDKEHAPYALALVASSLALVISKIPFLEPIGAIEATRINDQWIIAPTYEQILSSSVKITIAGTYDGICMVEGRADEMTEAEFVDVLFLAHDKIKKQIEWQREIQQEIGKSKEIVPQEFNWEEWTEKTAEFLVDERIKALNVPDKVERGKAMSELKKAFYESFEEQAEEQAVSRAYLDYVFDQVLKEKLTERIFETGKRIDGRDFDTVRAISTEVGLLPRNHGSALFNRGKTQALVSVTLGGSEDEQRVEDLMQGITIERNFMLHYNFPPFSVGEVKALRGPGRREVGHGHLAASALKAVLPNSELFPYTIRIVADMLSSDGSTSMATVCGSTMALMDAGVPISNMVSGIAMGLIKSDQGEFKVLSDIAGIEDAFGLMDFKVTGTDKGITAIQMDIKYKGGLPRHIFEKALAQAKIGRNHILTEMRKVLSKPSDTLSELVPQVVSLKVPTDKIGAIIGSGGKVIKEITAKTNTSIKIEDDGTVKIFGQPGEELEQAIKWVKTLAGFIEAGTEYQGIIKKITEFGMFVELAPGVDGLVHISNLPRENQNTLAQDFKTDDIVTVQVVSYDQKTGRIRLKII